MNNFTLILMMLFFTMLPQYCEKGAAIAFELFLTDP